MAPQQAVRPAPQKTVRFQEQTSYAHGIAAPPQPRSPYLPRNYSIPHLDADIILDKIRGQVFIEVSDLTGEHITEDHYREFLSEYIIVSFEKLEPHDKYNSAGERIKSTWAKCTRRRMPNVDNAKAREEIQRLNLKDNESKSKSTSLLKKQQSLGQNAQDQITRMGRDLSAEETDPRRFHTTLEQISWTQRPIIDGDEKVSRKHSTSKRKDHAKTKYERATITAYFKRCPRPDQLASELYHRLELEKREKQELLERQQRDRDEIQTEIRTEEARLKRIREERLREQERGPGPQHMRISKHMPLNQQMAPGQQKQPGQQMPTGRLFDVAQMPPQQGHRMKPPHAGQVPQQSIRLPSGQALPPVVQNAPTNNNQTPLPQVSGGDGSGHGATPNKRPTTPICVIHEPDRRTTARRRGKTSRSPSPSSAASSSLSSTTIFSDRDSDSGRSIITEPLASAAGSRRVANARRHHKKYPIRIEQHNSSTKPHVPRYVTEPANFGQRHEVDERAGPEPVYLVTGDRRRVNAPAATAKVASVPVDNLTQIRDAYRLGRADQRAEVVEELQHSGTRRHRAASPDPRRYEGRREPTQTVIHQRERDWERGEFPRIRRATRSEFERQRERDLDADFAGLQVGREARLENDRYNRYRAQRRREARALDEQEEIMKEIEEDEGRGPRKHEAPSFRAPFNPMPQGRSGGPFDRP